MKKNDGKHGRERWFRVPTPPHTITHRDTGSTFFRPPSSYFCPSLSPPLYLLPPNCPPPSPPFTSLLPYFAIAAFTHPIRVSPFTPATLFLARPIRVVRDLLSRARGVRATRRHRIGSLHRKKLRGITMVARPCVYAPAASQTAPTTNDEKSVHCYAAFELP